MAGKQSNGNEEEIFRLIKTALKDLIPDITGFTKISVESLMKQVKDKIGHLKDLSESSFEKFFKIAWNVEEKSCQTYSLEEALKWFKANVPSSSSGAVLFKINSSDGSITLHHCFLDKNQEPVFDGSYSNRLVYTLNISEDLKKQFGDKDMILFK